MRPSARAGALSSPMAIESFEVRYVAEGGGVCRAPLTEAWSVRFEGVTPVRRFASFKSQRNYPGRWWSATVGGHVGFESWLERDHLMLLDFDPDVVGIASQPFWLAWPGPDKVLTHAPDFFARRADGGAMVIDCRPLDRIQARDAEKFEATRRACDLLGWEYRVVGAPDTVRVANVRWLAGYRHPRHGRTGIGAVLRSVFNEPAPLMAGAEAAGDPLAVLPVLFHLWWRGDLIGDLSVPLHQATPVTAARAG